MFVYLELPEYHYTFDDDGENGGIPIITLEVMTDSSNRDPMLSSYGNDNTTSNFDDALTKDTGVHFLTENEELGPKLDNDKENGKEVPKARHDLLEYLLQNDGSVICKMCGEVLQSRTHWYRHKYKRHVAQPQNPAQPFQCEQCLVYYKSRKGYIGHIASRHSELLSDASPVLTNSQAESFAKENGTSVQITQELKEEPDPELVIPKTSVPNYTKHMTKGNEAKKSYRGREQIENQADWEERRSREEKLVADIIDRVRRECEAQPGPTGQAGPAGAAGPARRGYSRRSTVIQTDTFS